MSIAFNRWNEMFAFWNLISALRLVMTGNALTVDENPLQCNNNNHRLPSDHWKVSFFFFKKTNKTCFMRDLPKPLPCSNATSTWCKIAFLKKEIKTSFMPKPLAYPMLLPANLSYYIRVLSLRSTLKCHWWAVARNLYRLVNKFNHGLGFYRDSHVST